MNTHGFMLLGALNASVPKKMFSVTNEERQNFKKWVDILHNFIHPKTERHHREKSTSGMVSRLSPFIEWAGLMKVIFLGFFSFFFF